MANNFKPSDAAISHCQRTILNALRQGPVDTVYAREVLGQQGVAVRVLELRRRGYQIETRRRRVVDSRGRERTIALYVLHPSLESEGGDHD